MDGLNAARMAGTQSEIPREEWRTFLEEFSRGHENWIVTVETASAAGRLIDVEQLHLKAISIDSAEGNERIYVQMGDRSQEHVTHTVKRPVCMRVKTGAQAELDIASEDGTTTVLRLRAVSEAEEPGFASA